MNFGQAITRVVVEFFEHNNGAKLVLTHQGFPEEIFCKNVAQGTTESLDKLDSLVASEVLAQHL